MSKVVIVSAARTAMGGFQGEFSGVSAPKLGGYAVAGALERANLTGDQIDEVVMGCVLPAGMGQAPARQVALNGGIPSSVGCTTVNKMCGSGMKATMFGHDLIKAGSAETVMVGGIESMTNAPYLLEKARSGYRMGHGRVMDHMFLDGLEDCFGTGGLMGVFAENCAEKYQFSRQAQDAFAMTSLARAQKASEDGTFAKEIVGVPVKQKSGEILIARDEQPAKANADKIPTLKPAFKPDGTVTAANSSSISDGAAALILMSETKAKKMGLPILAEIVGHTTFAQDPAWFTTAPIGAMKALFQKTGWSAKDVDLFEINEAFAVVTMAAMQELGLPHEKVNIHGGACALGHPVGASGARIIVSLLNAMDKYGMKRGMASLCIGGGEATAIAVQK